MTTIRGILQYLLILLLAFSLVNCSGGQNCQFGGLTGNGVRVGASALPPCPVTGGGGGPSGGCSSTETPSEVLYSLNSTGTFLPFAISSTNGNLTQMCNTISAVLGEIASIDTFTVGKFVYVLSASGTTGKIYAFSVTGGNSGALVAVSGQPFTLAADTFTTGVHIETDPLGEFIFVTNFVTGKVHVLLIDTVTTPGALSEISGSPFDVPSPSFMAIERTGNFAYFPDPNHGQISVFQINIDGSLTLAAFSPNPIPINTGSGDFPNFALSIATGSTEVVYTANAKSVTAYSINLDGSLTALGGGPIQNTHGVQPIFLAVAETAGPTPAFVYVMDALSAGILGYQIQNGVGTLTEITGSPFVPTTNPTVHDMIADVNTTTNALFVQTGSGPATSFGGTIEVFTFNSTTGALTAPSGTSTLSSSTNMTITNTQ